MDVEVTRIGGKWLKRRLRVRLTDGGRSAEHIVEYNGHGLGYETVCVDGMEVARHGDRNPFATRSMTHAYRFDLAGLEATVAVRAWLLWELIPFSRPSMFYLKLGDRVVYLEGRLPKQPRAAATARPEPPPPDVGRGTLDR